MTERGAREQHGMRLRKEAVIAAKRAGVVVRPVDDLGEFVEIRRLFDFTWGGDPTNPTVTAELLRALSKSGAPVIGAYDAGGLVGGSVGFFGPPDERALHSHVTGVLDSARGRSVGFALKLFQRAWAFDRGLAAIMWTFDPLVRRNAHFNIVKLGALPVEYLQNFYGEMHDDINGTDDSDRLLMRWAVDECASPVCTAEWESVEVALSVGSSGGPDVHDVSGTLVSVAVPHDIELLRRRDPAVAKAWRGAVRREMAQRLSASGRIVGFDAEGRYVIDMRGEPA
ncbi:GNAT family N-acetyltransferase [uncultured Agrococcus sp.]|uniref:GNAT family N-acetyltransferase n=1 Tax=uncultured Agrococcus sp. TaxID=382258 RepID=UPI0025E21C46|nr:GNAT family N-acetyltransferase [uncultured Agrococcus sp.]